MIFLKKTFIFLFALVLVHLYLAQPIFGQTASPVETPIFEESLPEPSAEVVLPPQPEYHRARVTRVLSETRLAESETALYTQELEVQRLDTNEAITLIVGSEFQPLNQNQLLKKGTQVIIARQEVAPNRFEYVLADIYRLPSLIWLAVGLFLLVIVVARLQGLFAILGMGISFVVLITFILPQILSGQNPVVISIIGCSIVAAITVYLSHGVRRESHIALFSMLLSLLAVGVLSFLTVKAAQLVGLGSEEAYFLQFGPTTRLNLQGLFLGGIMLGTLGVLDDICLAQVSVVTQLKEAKPNIEFSELYRRSLAVGKDHVASLVNTLVLAYAGSSLPLFLLFTMNDTQPAWVALNSEIIAEEVVRTITGSIGLVLAVPLTTIAASYFVARKKVTPSRT